MRDESYGFENTKVRLEEIVTQVRKKDVSLEKSLDLLEEGVRLANQCTELIDKADWQEAGAPIAVDTASDAVTGDTETSDNVSAEATDSDASRQNVDTGEVQDDKSEAAGGSYGPDGNVRITAR